jgi:DNA-binding Lrp family transcriptional regulator
MIIAYVLAKVEAGKDQEVLKEVTKTPGVSHATPTYGMYDLHIEATFDTAEKLDSFIFENIRKIPGIKETVTLIALKEK